jgi:molybdopterin synthase catalytic subunit
VTQNHGMRVQIQTLDFDVGQEIFHLRQAHADAGAVVSFIGTVRDMGGGQTVGTLVLEHYPGMTEQSIEAILNVAHTRFDILASKVIHRVGSLQLQDQIVWVGVVSRHRGQAFLACEFVMDHLKTQAPFWKKEFSSQGGQWVEARCSDKQAAQRWTPTP